MGFDEREVFTQGPVVVFRWRNEEGWPVEYASPNAEEVFGYTAAQFMSGEIAYGAIVSPDCARRVADEVQTASASKHSSFVHEPYEIIRADGEKRWLYDATQIVRNSDGVPTHYMGYVIDVTTRVRSERERLDLESRLLHTQKLESLGVLAGGVAHDFNNLLTGILGHASLAQKTLEHDDPAREHVVQIERLAWQAAELTRQLLAYSGRGRFVTCALDLGELVDDMATMLDLVVSKKAELTLIREPSLPLVKVDPAQIQQIVMNLLANASDALADKSGKIRLRVGTRELEANTIVEEFTDWPLRPGRYVSLEIADDGMGMTVDTQSRLFDPFFSTKAEGHGLGLSAVLGIVRGHHGGLRVTTEVGVGTTFEIVLPITQDQAQEAVLPDEESWSGTGTVLVVDDKAAVRNVASNILAQLGFDTLCAADGARALELHASHKDKIVLVLLDLTMPVMDGRETLDALSKIAPDLPVVISSGYDSQSETDSVTKRASAFLQKPYRITEVRRAIRAAIG